MRDFSESSPPRRGRWASSAITTTKALLRSAEGRIGGKPAIRSPRAPLCVLCERDGTRLATLSDPDDWNDHCKLSTTGLSQYSDRRALSDGSLPEVPVTSGTESAAAVRPSEELSLFLPRDAELR